LHVPLKNKYLHVKPTLNVQNVHLKTKTFKLFSLEPMIFGRKYYTWGNELVPQITNPTSGNKKVKIETLVPRITRGKRPKILPNLTSDRPLSLTTWGLVSYPWKMSSKNKSRKKTGRL
jgi:hypothetical protein